MVSFYKITERRAAFVIENHSFQFLHFTSHSFGRTRSVGRVNTQSYENILFVVTHRDHFLRTHVRARVVSD